MDFEYNGNLEEKQRILQVAQEIISYYPEVTFERAKLIASLEEPITKNVDVIMYFKRLYNILFIVQQDKNISAKIYSEIIKVYNLYLVSGLHDDTIDSIKSEITKYFNKERLDFPVISEFY